MLHFCCVIKCSKRDNVSFFRIRAALTSLSSLVRGDNLNALSKVRREVWVKAVKALKRDPCMKARLKTNEFVRGTL